MTYLSEIIEFPDNAVSMFIIFFTGFEIPIFITTNKKMHSL